MDRGQAGPDPAPDPRPAGGAAVRRAAPHQHVRVRLAVDRDDELAAPAEQFVNAHVLDVAAVGEILEVAAMAVEAEVADEAPNVTTDSSDPRVGLGGVEGRCLIEEPGEEIALRRSARG